MKNNLAAQLTRVKRKVKMQGLMEENLKLREENEKMKLELMQSVVIRNQIIDEINAQYNP